MAVTAESCTGGMIASALTAAAGSSDVFDRGFVTYSNQSKHELLGVDLALIAAYGAVSEETAIAMAEGALARSAAQVAMAVTGIAGPGGASPAKPVGRVHIACAIRNAETTHVEESFGPLPRQTIRLLATASALRLALAQTASIA